jgi:hypothetical protein
MHDGEGEAGVDTAAVDMDSASSALAVVATLLGAGEVEVLAKAVEEGCAGIEQKIVVLTVDAELKRHSTFGRQFILSGGRGGAGVAARMGGAVAARPAAPRCVRKERRVTWPSEV